jgi:hypothetical protein
MIGRKTLAGVKMGTITTIVILIFLVFFLRFGLTDMTWDKLPEFIQHDYVIRMVVILGSFSFIFAFGMAFSMESQNIRCEKRVAKFAEKYNVGDSFWAIHRSIHMDDFRNAQDLRSKIFHFNVVDIKRGYYELTCDFRSGWSTKRTSMSDYMIFESKEKMMQFIRAGQQAIRDGMKEVIESV